MKIAWFVFKIQINFSYFDRLFLFDFTSSGYDSRFLFNIIICYIVLMIALNKLYERLKVEGIVYRVGFIDIIRSSSNDPEYRELKKNNQQKNTFVLVVFINFSQFTD